MLKKKHLNHIFICAAILVIIAFCIPFVNSVDASRVSQINRLVSIYTPSTDYDELSYEDKDKLYSIYSYINYSLNAKDYIPDYIDTSKINHGFIDYHYDDEGNVYYYNNDKEINVDGYKKIMSLNIREYYRSEPKLINDLPLDDLTITNSSKDDEIINKFKEYIGDVIDKEAVTNSVVDLGEEYDFYVATFDVYYNKTSKEISNLNVDGYLLTK